MERKRNIYRDERNMHHLFIISIMHLANESVASSPIITHRLKLNKCMQLAIRHIKSILTLTSSFAFILCSTSRLKVVRARIQTNLRLFCFFFDYAAAMIFSIKIVFIESSDQHSWMPLTMWCIWIFLKSISIADKF